MSRFQRRLILALSAAAAGAALFIFSLGRVGRLPGPLPGERGLEGVKPPPSPGLKKEDLKTAAVPASPAGGAPGARRVSAKDFIRQGKDLGIAAIVPPARVDEEREQQLMDKLAGPLSPEEARSAMSQLYALNRQAALKSGRAAPVLLNGRTPRLLARPGEAGGLSRTADFPRRSWSGASRAPLGASRLVSDAGSWRAFWRGLSPSQTAPPVDFSNEEALLLCPGPAPRGTAVEIISLDSRGRRLRVRYRLKPEPWISGRRRIWPYLATLVPKSGLKPEFEETR